MTPTNSENDRSFQDSLTNAEPITHYFYEYQGERSIDPMMLIESGIISWHELIYTNEAHDNSYLWELATSLLQDRQPTPTHSWVEWLRYRITMGALVPDRWVKSKPYPYKGLLISAIYFQEAKRLCLEGNPERAWHITVLGYYHLGLNTTPPTLQNTSKAAKLMHANRTLRIQALVLGALAKIKEDGSANSIKEAKQAVKELLHKNKDKFKDWLNEFDALVSDNTKRPIKAGRKNDVLERIGNLLDDWCLPSGPYPEIAEAFSQFNKRKKKAEPNIINPRSTSEEIPVDESEYYLRLINVLEEGYVLTMKVSRDDSK